MNTYIITFIVSVIVFVYILIRNRKDISMDKNMYKSSKDFYISQEYWNFVFKVLAVNILLYPIVYFLVGTFSVKRLKVYNKTYLVSVNVNSEINGNFILGSGSIEQKRVYILMKDLGGSRYKELNIPVSNTTIYEDIKRNKDYGYLETDVCDYNKSKYFDINKLKWRSGCFEIRLDKAKDNHKYRLHVPKGTIIKEMRVN